MQEQRFHSLDACRAVMMLLGLVLHVAMAYMVYTKDAAALPEDDPGRWVWLFIDNTTSANIDILHLFIHIFRMPVFFILAGFFAALIAAKYGAHYYLKNRLMRIALPLLICWAIIMPSQHWVAVLANNLIDKNLHETVPWPGYFNNIWNNTGAFWFLYFLVFFSVLAFVFHRLATGSVIIKRVERVLCWLNQRLFLFIACLIALTFLLILHSSAPLLPDDQDFLPHPALLAFYGLCFALGWFWYHHQVFIFQLEKYLLHFVVIAGISTVLFFIYLNRWGQSGYSLDAFLVTNLFHGIALWSLSFVSIGLFTRFCQSDNPFWRYIADSSYFVYIIHVHILLLIHALIYPIQASAEVKFTLSTLATLIISILLYHLICRHSWIGLFLNGRKYHWNSNKVSKKISY